jgi:hypothetical protein
VKDFCSGERYVYAWRHWRSLSRASRGHAPSLVRKFSKSWLASKEKRGTENTKITSKTENKNFCHRSYSVTIVFTFQGTIIFSLLLLPRYLAVLASPLCGWLLASPLRGGRVGCGAVG